MAQDAPGEARRDASYPSAIVDALGRLRGIFIPTEESETLYNVQDIPSLAFTVDNIHGVKRPSGNTAAAGHRRLAREAASGNEVSPRKRCRPRGVGNARVAGSDQAASEADRSP